jgi:BlaI family penicillinase repressor
MQLSETEWKVMQCLWRQSPLSARAILGELADETGWAYTTVKTMLVRLEDKGAVRSTLVGKTHQYVPRVTRDKAQSTAVRSLLDRAFEGAFSPLLQNLLGDARLSAQERAALTEALDKLERDES